MTNTIVRLRKTSSIRAAWLTARPWYTWPYYRCPRNGMLDALGGPDSFAFNRHDPDNACCWDTAIKDWIEASRR